MARITVDDCLEFIPNRFELTLAASLHWEHRACRGKQ